MGVMASDLAQVGKAIGSPARAAMINVLFDGASHSAGALARAAGVTSATASQHLALLTEAGLVTVQERGRYRYFALANARIASALEQLGSPVRPPVTSLRLSREQRRVRLARTCYDHLAGQLGVALADRFVTAGWIDPGITAVTAAGADAFAEHFGIDVSVPPTTRRPVLRACPDWTEKREHIAGALGAQVADAALTRGWVIRKPDSRGLTITQEGLDTFQRLDVDITVNETVSSR